MKPSKSRERLEKLTANAHSLFSQDQDQFTLREIKAKYKLEEVLHELDIYQAELETQNDELVRSTVRLEEEKSRYQNLFRFSPFPTLVIKSTGEVQSYNRAAFELLDIVRYSSRPSISVYSLLEFDSGDVLHRSLEEIGESNHKMQFDVDAIKEQGSIKLKACLSMSVKSNEEMPAEYLLILQDLSTEEALRAQQLQFSNLVDQCSEIILVCSTQGHITSHNRRFLEFFDVTPLDMVKKPLEEVLPRRLSKEIDDFMNHQSKHDVLSTSVTFEHYHEKNNLTYYLDAHLFWIKDEQQDITENIGIIINDCTSRINQEKELQLAMQVFNEGQQGLMITDGEAKIKYVNKAFERITGYGFDEIMGQNPSILSSGQNDEQFYAEFWQVLQDQGKWEGEIWNKKKDGEPYPQWLNVAKYPADSEVASFYIATFADMTTQKQNEEKIKRLAYFDSLTNAGNRHALKENLEKIFTSENTDSNVTLFFIDLDDFKIVNDTHGHNVGDVLLRQLVHRIRNIIRDKDELYRLGGDEFLLLIDDIDARTMARKAAEICEAARKPYSIFNHEIVCTVSVGVVRYPEDGNNFEQLMKQADVALYRAKEQGRDRFQFFEPSLLEKMEERLHIERGIRNALANNGFTLHFQPQFSGESHEVVACEVLLRWHDEVFGDTSVERVIEIAEHTGLILNITKFVLYEAIQAIKLFNRSSKSKITFAVNLSCQDLLSDGHFAELEEMIDHNRQIASQLELEITERTLMTNPELVKQRLESLRQYGVSIAVDDFGTGYSSLAYLGQFEMDALKIDKSFVAGIGRDKRMEAICVAVISLANTLGLQSVAEGVETKAQVEWLKQQGCTLIQGFVASKAVELETICDISNKGKIDLKS